MNKRQAKKAFKRKYGMNPGTEKLKEYLQKYKEDRNDTAEAIIELKEGED